MGGEAFLGWAEEFHSLFSQRLEATPGSWAGYGGPAPYNGRSWDSFAIGWSSHICILRVEAWEKEASHALLEVAPKCSLAGAIICGRYGWTA